jgi:glycosyltransferase involved in cell wall biosynthesis
MTAPASTRRLVSLVFPIYNEEGNIPLLFSTITGILAERPDLDFELIFINDGSRDRSLELLGELAEKDDRVKVIDFSRNFGHQIAVTAGLDQARGNAVIVMDSDLQDPPRVCLELIQKWEEGWDVAYAQRRTRKDTLFKRATANLFYRTLELLADIDIPRNTGDFRIMDRAVVDQMVAMREHKRFLRGMVSYVGFKQIAVPFDRDERHAGETGYPFRKMVSFATDGILSFSVAPLVLISRVGYAFSALAFVGIVYALLSRILLPNVVVQGWTFVVISILGVGGVQLIMLGVLGSYIGRIYTEAQGRPLYIVRSIIGGKPTQNMADRAGLDVASVGRTELQPVGHPELDEPGSPRAGVGRPAKAGSPQPGLDRPAKVGSAQPNLERPAKVGSAGRTE